MIERLLENNRRWSEERTKSDPGFFERLSAQQAPDFLWLGCSDSRVPANQIVGLDPGEVFVHRNVANLAHPGDLNSLAVMQFAIGTLGVRHVIVCGHYGCGGVRAALSDQQFGLIDNWLRPIKEVYRQARDEIDALDDEAIRVDRLCELNVKQQVLNVAANPAVQSAWHKGQEVAVHGWVYGLHDGRVRDLGVSMNRIDQLDKALRYSPS